MLEKAGGTVEVGRTMGGGCCCGLLRGEAGQDALDLASQVCALQLDAGETFYDSPPGILLEQALKYEASSSHKQLIVDQATIRPRAGSSREARSCLGTGSREGA